MAQTVTTLANGDKQIVITGTETWTFPSDWNDAANKIEAYGCGGSGLTGVSTASSGGGGGGGYHSVVNFPLQKYSLMENGVDGQKVVIIQSPLNPASTVGYLVFDVLTGFDGDTGAPIYAQAIAGSPGVSPSSTGAFFGSGGSARPTSFTLYDPTTSASTVYTCVSFAGGNGGAGRVSNTAAGGGGGGAAGPNGAGGAGGANSLTNPTIGRGGGGGNGGTAGSSTSATGGTAGTGAGAGGAGGAASTSGSAGGAGTNAATTYIFSGGGGGGAGDGTGTTVGGAGGLYGAGGGGGASSTISTQGLGSSGALVITYTPVVAATSSNFFLLF